MPNRSKWVVQIRACDSVAKAAGVTLKSRLASVVHFLRLAADHADETPEHVHQLRVYTRRSLAALSMYSEVLAQNEAKWFRKRLRRIRKVAGEARDLDVFSQRYEKETGRDQAKFLRQVRKRRRKAQRPIVKLNTQLILSGRFETHADRLLASIAWDGQSAEKPLDQWVQSKLAKVCAKFFDAIPLRPDNLKALHRFRVRGKELRYTMELSATLFPPEFRSSLYPLITQLQNRLGDVNDHAIAQQRLITWSKKAKSQRQADHLLRLISREREQLETSIERFTKWWNPEFANHLEASFRTVTSRN
jgi:CHAD domain-containing protein